MLVSRNVAADVNLDGVIDFADETAIAASPFFGGVSCNNSCGRADVNADGVVNTMDTSTVRAAATYPTDVRCGAVYASSFSCGAYRRAPPQPAVGISLDEVHYRISEGVLVARRHNVDESLVPAEFVLELLHERGAVTQTHSNAMLDTSSKVEKSAWNVTLQAQTLLDKIAQRGMVLTDVLAAVATILVCAFIVASTRRK